MTAALGNSSAKSMGLNARASDSANIKDTLWSGRSRCSEELIIQRQLNVQLGKWQRSSLGCDATESKVSRTKKGRCSTCSCAVVDFCSPLFTVIPGKCGPWREIDTQILLNAGMH